MRSISNRFPTPDVLRGTMFWQDLANKLETAEDAAKSERCSLREQLSEATGAAAEAGQELARLRDELEGVRAEAAEAAEAKSKHEVELRDGEERLAEAQAQVCAWACAFGCGSVEHATCTCVPGWIVF